MRVLLAEIIEEDWEISTPFIAYLGQIPCQVFFINEKTACVQEVGKDDRKIVRLDFLWVNNPEKLRKRPADEMKRVMQEARDRGRENGRLNRLMEQYLAP